MTRQEDYVDLGAALSMRTRSTVVRLAITAVIGVLLWTMTDWRPAPAWWAAYAVLQLLLIRVSPTGSRPLRLYGLSLLSYAVAGLPAWQPRPARSCWSAT